MIQIRVPLLSVYADGILNPSLTDSSFSAASALFIDLAPVTGGVTGQKLQGSLTGLAECLQRTGCADDLTQREARGANWRRVGVLFFVVRCFHWCVFLLVLEPIAVPYRRRGSGELQAGINRKAHHDEPKNIEGCFVEAMRAGAAG